MGYVVRNRFFADPNSPVGPVRYGDTVQTNQAPMQQQGASYGAANAGDNRFLPNGQIQLSAQDPDAARQMQQHPGQYTMQGGQSQVPQGFQNMQGAEDPRRQQLAQYFQQHPQTPAGTYQGEATKGTAISASGGFTASPEQQAWMQQQLQQTNSQHNQDVSYDSGGLLPEDITGVGASGRRYHIRGGERVVNQQGESLPGVPGQQNADGQMDPNTMAKLQAMMGRRLIQSAKGGPVRKTRTNETGPESQNTARAVNSPVLRITPDQVREMMNNPRLHDFLQVLMEAENRGGVQVSEQGAGQGAQSTTTTGAGTVEAQPATPGEVVPPETGGFTPPPQPTPPPPTGENPATPPPPAGGAELIPGQPGTGQGSPIAPGVPIPQNPGISSPFTSTPPPPPTTDTFFQSSKVPGGGVAGGYGIDQTPVDPSGLGSGGYTQPVESTNGPMLVDGSTTPIAAPPVVETDAQQQVRMLSGDTSFLA